MKQVTITTDGACWPNPGPGGWSAVLRYGSAVREICGSESNTTNNRMEFRAMTEGLRALKEPCVVTLRSDSHCALAWARRIISPTGKKKGCRLEQKAREEFIAASKGHNITLEWVRGHNGDPDNERADALAEEKARWPF